MKSIRMIVIAVLIFLSSSAWVGSAKLISDPNGNPWGVMPQSLLQHSPFHSYLIPGIVLLAANGLLALWVLYLTITRGPHLGIWIAFQGFILLGWLMVECLMVRMVIWPHYLYGGVALTLILFGFLLWRRPDDGRAGTPHFISAR